MLMNISMTISIVMLVVMFLTGIVGIGKNGFTNLMWKILAVSYTLLVVSLTFSVVMAIIVSKT